MRYSRIVLQTLLILFGVSGTTTLYSQSQSLADLARQERERKAQERAAKVYTNSDIPAATSSPAPATPATQATTSQTPSQAQGPGAVATPASAAEKTEPEEKSPADLEKEYREKFAQLRAELSFEEKKLDVMQRELNLMQTQYYSDPNVALREQTTRGEINQRMQEIETQKQAVEKVKQAIADLEEELRKKGLPPGWAR